jgi:hypothetical protein
LYIYLVTLLREIARMIEARLRKDFPGSRVVNRTSSILFLLLPMCNQLWWWLITFVAGMTTWTVPNVLRCPIILGLFSSVAVEPREKLRSVVSDQMFLICKVSFGLLCSTTWLGYSIEKASSCNGRRK